MKFLIVLVVLVVGMAWWLMGRKRIDKPASPPPQPAPDPKAQAGGGRPLAMLACAHCGLHLPSADALRDSEGRAYCGEPHRAAGPGRG
jgi:uncharacterized protein